MSHLSAVLAAAIQAHQPETKSRAETETMAAVVGVLDARARAPSATYRQTVPSQTYGASQCFT